LGKARFERLRMKRCPKAATFVSHLLFAARPT